MGHTQAQGMKEAVHDGLIEEAEALAWHLQCNHYPPLSLELVPVAQAVLDALRVDEPDTVIAMPDGWQFRERDSGTARDIADSMHLWDLV